MTPLFRTFVFLLGLNLLFPITALLAQTSEENSDDLLLIIDEDEPAASSNESARFEQRAIVRGGFEQVFRQDLIQDLSEYVFETHGRFNMSSSVELSRTLKIDVGGRVRYLYMEQRAETGPSYPFGGRYGRWDSSTELRDLSVRWNPGDLSLRVGNQILGWGSTDFSRPLDVLNPFDFRDGLSTSGESQALPVPMIRMDYRVAAKVNLQVAYIPFFYPHKVYLFGNDFAPSLSSAPAPLALLTQTVIGGLHPTLWDEAQPLLQSSFLPSYPLAEGQGAAAIQFSAGGFDVTVNYAYVYDRSPHIVVDQVKMGGLFTEPALGIDTLGSITSAVQANYHRTHMGGFSLATVFGDFGFRSDVAYFSNRTFYKDVSTVVVPEPFTTLSFQASILSGAFGMDYVYEDRFDMSLEINKTYLITNPYPPILLTSQLFGVMRMRFFEDRSLQLTAGGMLGLADFDHIAFGECRYRQSARHAWTLGVQLFGGPNEQTIGGQWDKNDMAYFKYEWFL
jgi:hypothetical protein